MSKTIDFYNQERLRYSEICRGLKKSKFPDFESVLLFDSTKISWGRAIKNDLIRNSERRFEDVAIVNALYRPFSKTCMYFSKYFNNMVYQMPRIFPNASAKNRVMALTGLGTPKEFSVIMTDVVPDLQVQANGQCFPLYLYENVIERALDVSSQDDMFSTTQPASESSSKYTRTDGISAAGLAHFLAAYPGEVISKEDLFYYVYGLLHSPDYREGYADNLSKELPRIPCVKTAADFWAYSQGGRKLADLHLDYETAPCHPVEYESGALLMAGLDDADYRVTQMKFASKADKSRVVYNHKITMTGIPLEAYEYVVNGKPALEWVMERQAVTMHKDSGIVNDANLWATETMGNARYPLELFQRVITVSLETMKIVRALPPLEIMASTSSN